MLSFFLSACSKKSSSLKKDSLSFSLNDSDMYKDIVFNKIMQQEAMLFNIPLPLYDERIVPESYDNIEDETIALGYKSPLTVNQAISFFLCEMERCGWQHLITFQGFESVLQFKNPHFFCTILIRSLVGMSSSIFIYMKKRV